MSSAAGASDRRTACTTAPRPATARRAAPPHRAHHAAAVGRTCGPPTRPGSEGVMFWFHDRQEQILERAVWVRFDMQMTFPAPCRACSMKKSTYAPPWSSRPWLLRCARAGAGGPRIPGWKPDVCSYLRAAHEDGAAGGGHCPDRVRGRSHRGAVRPRHGSRRGLSHPRSVDAPSGRGQRSPRVHRHAGETGRRTDAVRPALLSYATGAGTQCLSKAAARSRAMTSASWFSIWCRSIK